MNRVKPLLVLYLLSIFIVVSGIAFSIYSYFEKTTFMVLNSEIPGMIFGIVFVFLGVRYFRALHKFEKVISGSNLKFSWSNFGNLVKNSKN